MVKLGSLSHSVSLISKYEEKQVLVRSVRARAEKRAPNFTRHAKKMIADADAQSGIYDTQQTMVRGIGIQSAEGKRLWWANPPKEGEPFRFLSPNPFSFHRPVSERFAGTGERVMIEVDPGRGRFMPGGVRGYAPEQEGIVPARQWFHCYKYEKKVGRGGIIEHIYKVRFIDDPPPGTPI